MPSIRSRRFCITFNNFTETAWNEWTSRATGPSEEMKYWIWGKETSASGTPHLQGYIEFNSKKTFAWVKQFFDNRIHLESARGTGLSNRTYCSKEGNFKESGEYSRQGRRRDLEEIKDLLDNGASNKKIAQEYFGTWITHRQSFQAYRNLVNLNMETPSFQMDSFPVDWNQSIPTVWNSSLILWGEPGIGKTEFAKTIIGTGFLMISHMDDLLRFQPDEHKGLIFDDMDFTHTPRGSQIHLLDWDNDRSIHCRYRSALIPKHTKKIFTTNNHLGYIFSDQSTDGAIKRRLTSIELKK